MVKAVAWGESPKSNNSGGNGGYGFVRVQSGERKTIRPISKAICVGEYYYEGKYAICEDPYDLSFHKKHEDKGLRKPAVRYVSFCFDRDDDNRLKTYKMPSTVFEMIGKRKTFDGKNPAHASDGSDFTIILEEDRAKKGAQRYSYTVHHVGYTPLTKEEIEEVKKIGSKSEDIINKLLSLYKPLSDEEIEEKLFGDSENSSSSTSDDVEKESEEEVDDFGDDAIEDSDLEEEGDNVNFD